MKICLPIEEDQGLDSMVYGHFGSAPGFLLYNTETGDLNTVANENVNHQPGACNPLKSLAGIDLDFVVVAGIGGGALMKLNQAGIRVFQASGNTIKENIDALNSQGLSEFTMRNTCKGHGNGGGCAH